jgi:hypothetical protein
MGWNQHRTYIKPLLLLLTLLFILALTSGCVSIQANPNNPIARVAMLPVINNTNNLDGPVFIRRDLNAMVGSWFYETMPLEKIDEALRDKYSITLGGQLDFTNPGAGAPSPQELGELLGVDGLFYTTLIDFNQVIIGVYNKRKVKANSKLVNARTGEVIWQNEAEQSKSEVNLSVSGALQSVIQTVAATAIQKALKVNPLDAETKAVVSKLSKTMPTGPSMTGGGKRTVPIGY